MYSIFVGIMFVTSGYGLILPLKKTDGSLDVTSLLSHIALLEQANQQSTAEISELKSELRVALEDLKDLMEVKSDLKATQTEVAVLQSQIKSVQRPTVHTDVSSELASLKARISSVEANSNAGGHQANFSNEGVTFTRWGRTTCPSGNKMIYKGYTGGTQFKNKASSATILCLPDHPIYDEHTPGQQYAFIYGTEYETGISTGNHMKSLQNEDMPCVVCESETKRSVIMVPARNQCYPDWNLEYKGYLMGAAHDHASAEFVCVDNDAESIAGGQANMDGQSLYLVESKCGPLPCPPYKDNWELTCAVCSQ